MPSVKIFYFRTANFSNQMLSPSKILTQTPETRSGATTELTSLHSTYWGVNSRALVYYGHGFSHMGSMTELLWHSYGWVTISWLTGLHWTTKKIPEGTRNECTHKIKKCLQCESAINSNFSFLSHIFHLSNANYAVSLCFPKANDKKNV